MDSPPLPPPPPYAEEEEPHSKGAQKQLRLNRKPVPSRATIDTTNDSGHGISSRPDSKDAVDFGEPIPPLPPRPDLSLETSGPPRAAHLTSPPTPPTGTEASTLGFMPTNSTPFTASPDSSKSSAASYIQNAYREARHFAGGLIAHPSVSTKHFTILRHSHGLVFYKGTSTSLAISIFSDSPLPPDRTLWLQSKGWTGKTGMRAKALFGQNGSWLNVTPTIEVSASQLDAADERAWQRDIASFRKKAQAKIRNTHVLRESAVVRIPVEAEDGYFQILLCLGDKKKTLCPSPVFRILSTSRSPSSIRGASLSTLPLELGAMVLGTYASNTVGRVVSPVTSTVQSSVQQYMPSWKTQQAASMAYDVSGAENKVSSALEDASSQYNQARQLSILGESGDETALDHGPTSPYPIRFYGRGESTLDHEVDQSHFPSCTLSSVDSNVLHRLHGHYFGWIRRSEKSDSSHPWHQMAISVLPIDVSQLTRVSIATASKRIVSVRFITEESDLVIYQALFEVVVMGFIRADEPKQRALLARGLQAGDEAAAEAAMLSDVQDTSVVQYYLDHPSWAPDATPSKSEDQAEKLSPLDKAKAAYTNTRITAQNHIDRIPLHKLGIRAPSDSMKDKLVITNGFFVPRG